jgi:hexosaminidase
MWAGPSLAAAPPSLIPAPQAYEAGQGAFPITSRTPIVVPAGDAEARQVGEFLADALRRSRKFELPVVDTASPAGAPAIRLRRMPGDAGSEAYKLRITPGEVEISASGTGGLLYGAASLWQLASPADANAPAVVAAAEIQDAPRFAWRGFMLDSCRHFQSPALIRRVIDWMALHKLNTLHWHLTDDQAWRLEIKKYPRLTSFGAWRVEAGEGPARDIDPATGKPRLYGGFYSQDEVRALVAYAAARHIVIVPEIEMPGHATAAIAAYPELASTPTPPTAPSSDWGVLPNLYNPADERTFRFLEDVLTETMALFPSRYIHVGGDEAVKVQWNGNPAIQAKIHELGLKDADQLQSWMVQRMERFLNAHGRRLIGWDEILQGGIAPNATVMSWRGIDGAITAAKAGHDTVLAPAPTLYLDNRQSDLPDEPPGRGAVISLKAVYTFNPAPPQLSDTERGHILGVQANLWTEHVPTDEDAEQMMFPRLAALSEVAWSPESQRSWPDFLKRLPEELARDRALGLHARHSAFEVRVDQDVGSAPGQAAVTLSNQTGFGEIRYTLDGRAPTPASQLYAGPLSVPLPAKLRTAAFDGRRQISGETVSALDAASVRWRDNHQMKLCTDSVSLNLIDDAPVNGRRAVYLVDVMNPCWIYPQADLSGVSAIKAAVGQLPFDFQFGGEEPKVRLTPPSTPEGELEVRIDSCDGERLAVLPLDPAVANPAVTVLSGAISPHSGRHDLCFRFNRSKIEPMWAVDWVQLALGRP